MLAYYTPDKEILFKIFKIITKLNKNNKEAYQKRDIWPVGI